MKLINKETSYKESLFILLIFIFIFFVFGIYFYIFDTTNFSQKNSDWGDFGSYIGGLLSPILAIGSLYYVVKTFKHQSFATTFNLLLEQHNKLADDISKPRGKDPSIINEMLDKMLDEISDKKSYKKSHKEPLDKSLTNHWLESKAYNTEVNNKYSINKYIRVLYQLFKFIDDNCPEKKGKYTKIVRSFLSSDILTFLALDCCQISKENQNPLYKNYKKYLEKFEILEHLYTKNNKFLKTNDLLIISARYKASAFGDCKNTKHILNKIHDKINWQKKQINNNLDNYKKIKDELYEIESFINNHRKTLIEIYESYNKNQNLTNEEIEKYKSIYNKAPISLDIYPINELSRRLFSKENHHEDYTGKNIDTKDIDKYIKKTKEEKIKSVTEVNTNEYEAPLELLINQAEHGSLFRIHSNLSIKELEIYQDKLHQFKKLQNDISDSL